MILTVCPNTALDKIFFVKKWTPGVPMRTNNMATCVGGKGLDSSVVLAQLGIETIGMGFFSGKIGEELIEILEEYGIIPDPVWVGGVNRVAYVIAEESTNIHSHVIVGQVEVNEKQITEFTKKFDAQIGKAEWVIFAGSIPPSVNSNFYYGLIESAKKAGVPSLIDAQKAFMRNAIGAKPDVVKMNWEEFEWTFGINAPTFEELCDKAKAFREKKQINDFILTLGEEGILAFTTEGNYHVKAPLQKPLNAAGAGDSVSSTIVWRRTMGESWKETLHWASAVSAAAVLTKRTGDFHMQDVDRIYKDVIIKDMN